MFLAARLVVLVNDVSKEGETLASIIGEDVVTKLEVKTGSLTETDLAVPMPQLQEFIHTATEIAKIPEKCFYSHSSLANVSVKVAEIGNLAFGSCSQLVEFTLYGQPTIVPEIFTASAIEKFVAYDIVECVPLNLGKLKVAHFLNMTKVPNNFFLNLLLLEEVQFADEPIDIGEGAFVSCNFKTFPSIKIKSIGSEAFSYGKFETVTISGNATIAVNAFSYCSVLTSFSAPEMTTVGGSIFTNCNILVSLNFPKITSIPSNFGSQLPNLTTVTVDTTNALSVGYAAFKKCPSLKWIEATYSSIEDEAYLGCSFTEVTVKGNVIFRADVFKDCTSLTTFSAPDVTSSIGGIFAGCKKLATINIPQVSQLYDNFAQDLTALTTVTLRNTEVSVGRYAFSGCTSLAWPSWTFSSIGFNAFAGCSFPEVTILGNPTIASNAFNGCKITKFIALELTTVAEGALNGLGPIQHIEIPKVSVLPKNFMLGVTTLTEIVVSNDVPITIGEGCFSGCTSFPFPKWNFAKLSRSSFSQNTYTDITIAGTPELEADVFASCTLLTQFSAPDLTSLSSSLFSGCSSLSTVSLPMCTSIGNSAFKGLAALTTVTLKPESTISVGENAFAGCAALPFLELKYSAIGDLAFQDCQFDSIKILGTPVISKTAFMGCNRVVTFTEDGLNEVDFLSTFPDCPIATITLPSTTNVVSLPSTAKTFTADAVTAVTSKTLFTTSLPNLQEIHLKNLVTLDFSFSGCTSLSKIVFEAINEIGVGTDFGGTALQEISLPQLKTVSPDVLPFGECNLMKITLPASPPKTLNKNTFAHCLSCELDIPTESQQIYDDDLSIDGDCAEDARWCGLVVKGITPKPTPTPTPTPEEPDASQKSSRTGVIVASVSVIGILIIVSIAIFIIWNKKKSQEAQLHDPLNDPVV